MQVVIPWWVTWIVTPAVLLLRQTGLLLADKAATIVA